MFPIDITTADLRSFAIGLIVAFVSWFIVKCFRRVSSISRPPINKFFRRHAIFACINNLRNGNSAWIFAESYFVKFNIMFLLVVTLFIAWISISSTLGGLEDSINSAERAVTEFRQTLASLSSFESSSSEPIPNSEATLNQIDEIDEGNKIQRRKLEQLKEKINMYYNVGITFIMCIFIVNAVFTGLAEFKSAVSFRFNRLRDACALFGTKSELVELLKLEEQVTNPESLRKYINRARSIVNKAKGENLYRDLCFWD